MKTNEREPAFEQKMERLKEIVHKLETGERTLDEAMRDFEEGIRLGKDCYDTLEQAEKKVEILLKENENVVGKKEIE